MAAVGIAARPASGFSAAVVSVQVGGVAPLGPKGVPSGFVKRPVKGPVGVAPLGLVADQQADLEVHGGPDKAVYAYPMASYALWRLDFPEHTPLWAPGGVGENLTIDGIDETGVNIGDIVRVGRATLQVTQPRQPCYKFALRFADSRMPKAMVANGRSGWYYRVLEKGVLAAGDCIEMIERPNPDWTIARFNRFVAAKAVAAEDYAELTRLPGLSAGWRATAQQWLARMAAAKEGNDPGHPGVVQAKRQP